MRPVLGKVRAYVYSGLILCTAAAISWQTGAWHWFARSGSLVAIIGVLLTSSQILENSKKLRERHRRLDTVQHHDWALSEKRDALLSSRYHEEDIWASGVCGLNLLIFGTLIWGFGDLVGLFY